jgi:hypothetical protein
MVLSEGAKIGTAAFGRKTGKSGGGLRNQSADKFIFAFVCFETFN